MAGVEQLGHAEIHDLDGAVGADQHVLRLQIAMHDAVLMRVVDGRAHLAEEPQPSHERQRLVAGHVRDGPALHEIHGEPCLTRRQRAAVEQAHDVRMAEAGEDGALGAEATRRLAVEERQARELHGDLLGVGAVGAFGAEDAPHAAFAEQVQQPPGPGQRARLDRVTAVGCRRGVAWIGVRPRGEGRVARRACRRCRQEVARGVVGGEQGQDLGANLGPPRGGRLEVGLARAGRHIERVGEPLVDVGPECRVARHRGSASADDVSAR